MCVWMCMCMFAWACMCKRSCSLSLKVVYNITYCGGGGSLISWEWVSCSWLFYRGNDSCHTRSRQILGSQPSVFSREAKKRKERAEMLAFLRKNLPDVLKPEFEKLEKSYSAWAGHSTKQLNPQICKVCYWIGINPRSTVPGSFCFFTHLVKLLVYSAAFLYECWMLSTVSSFLCALNCYKELTHVHFKCVPSFFSLALQLLYCLYYIGFYISTFID